MRGVQAGRELGKKFRDGLEAGEDAELKSLAEEVRDCTATMGKANLDRLLLETEEAELSSLEACPRKQIVLTKIA